MKIFITILLCLFSISEFVYAQTGSTSYKSNNESIQANNTVSIGEDTAIAGDKGVFIGRYAGDNTDTEFNVSIGYYSGRNLSGTSNGNIGIGAISMFNSDNSTENVAIGYNAGRDMVGAVENLMLGARAGEGNQGNYNIMLGRASGKLTTGDENVFIGANSATQNGYGSGNVYVGAKAGYRNAGNENVFIGNRAGERFSDLDHKLIIESGDSNYPLIFGDFLQDKVGINTTNLISTLGSQDLSGVSLYVSGCIITDEIIVQPGWADYVFAEDYNLMPIRTLEKFILTNKRLPNFPSEETVDKNGIKVGDITRIQQEKIEELTLYIIQLEKRLSKIEDSSK